jgi:tetratricopeptide (TPR) repeat protein
MFKLQILIIVLAIASIFFISYLPKGIIKKEKNLTDSKVNTTDVSVPDVQVHSKVASENDKILINNLTNQYIHVSDKEKKIKFADSLILNYRRLHQYDSAAKYAEAAAVLDASPIRIEKAGDAYNDAFAMSDEESKTFYSEKARSFYNKALKESPGNLELKSKLAMTYIGGEETMQGVQLLREVIKTDPKNETAIYNLGILSMQSGQYNKAIDRFKDLIDINPANANAHFYLGMSFMKAGEKRKAKIAFEAARALENDPAFQTTVETYLKELLNEADGGTTN